LRWKNKKRKRNSGGEKWGKIGKVVKRMENNE
jgi:hypothetical protein